MAKVASQSRHDESKHVPRCPTPWGSHPRHGERGGGGGDEEGGEVLLPLIGMFHKNNQPSQQQHLANCQSRLFVC